MNLKIAFKDATIITVNGIAIIKEEGSYTNFYNSDDQLPVASAITTNVNYWQRI
jgi:hypothetical protein